MDKERARFILNSFRPNGTDVGDEDFAEALKLALEDRELGEWLAGERAFDAAFATALGTLPLPGHLREDILASLAIERGDYPQAEDSEDAAMIGAIATIHPPTGFREQLIAAMEATAQPPAPANVVPFWKKLAMPAAAAAGIALALFLTRQGESSSRSTAAVEHPISSNIVQASFVKTLHAPDFSLEMKEQDYQKLIDHLCSCGLPRADDLPPGLIKLKGVGCRELVIDGKHGSLICFDGGEDGLIHLVVFKREDVTEKGPFDKPEITRQNGWSAARWQSEDHSYMLMGTLPPEKLASLF